MLAKWLAYRRLPWVRVIEPRDCGASVFASVARFYGHHISLEQARHLVSADRNGTTLASLRDGGRAIGLEARPAEAIYEALGHIQLPAIVHLKGREGHYAVLYRWSPTSVVVLDPNLGLRTLRREAFEARWSGYLVEYRPTPRLQPRAPDVRPLGVFLRFIAQNKRFMLLALLCGLLGTSLGWMTSFFLRILVDDILPNRDTALLMALGLGLVLVSGVQAALQFLRMWLSAFVGQRIQFAYGTQFIAHLLRLPMQIFDARCVTGLVMRVGQAEVVQFAITEGTIGLIMDGVMFLAALGVILYYDPLAAAIACAAVPVILAVTLMLNGRAYTSQLALMVHGEEFTSYMVDSFEGLRTIKLFAAEPHYQDLLVGKLRALVGARMNNRVAMALPNAWSWLATALITAGILWYGSSRVLAGQITAGELLVLFGMVTFYLAPVQRFPSTLLTIRTALIGVDRLEEICTLPTEAARTVDPTPLPVVRGRIVFDRVSFAYNRYKGVLKEVSLAIEPGETVAIVGETGSGKTSLANLIAGFYLPVSGDVSIDGVSTRNLRPEDLRRSVSAVFQNAHLLQQSVRENITMMREEPHEAVRAAAQIAQADEFIGTLLNGYDAQVSRGGENFSSGQTQRIALARALMKDTPILVLDEATSSLDGATEQAFLQALEANRRGRTTVVIAHRLSTVLQADRIFVLDDGALVESGTHAELLARRGRYYELFNGQMIDGARRAVGADVEV